MKIFSVIVLMISAICFSQLAFAQSFSFGGGIPYNITIEEPGLNLRAYYNVGKEFCFGPEAVFFLPKSEIEGNLETEIRIQEYSLNTHYIFELGEKVGIYPVVGLNYTIEKEEITYLDQDLTEEETFTAFGANLGGGIHFPFGNITPFAEYAYVLSELSEQLVTVGVFYTIGREGE